MGEKGGHEYDRLDKLVSRHRGLIRKLCWRKAAGDEAVCDDLVQECYLVLWLRLPSMRPNVSALEEAAWVVWQCRSVFSHLRQRGVIDTVNLDTQVADRLPASISDSHGDLVDEFATCLNFRERHALDLMLKDFTDLEIAERLGMRVDSFQRMRLRMIDKMKHHKI